MGECLYSMLLSITWGSVHFTYLTCLQFSWRWHLPLSGSSATSWWSAPLGITTTSRRAHLTSFSPTSPSRTWSSPSSSSPSPPCTWPTRWPRARAGSALFSARSTPWRTAQRGSSSRSQSWHSAGTSSGCHSMSLNFSLNVTVTSTLFPCCQQRPEGSEEGQGQDLSQVWYWPIRSFLSDFTPITGGLPAGPGVGGDAEGQAVPHHQAEEHPRGHLVCVRPLWAHFLSPGQGK